MRIVSLEGPLSAEPEAMMDMALRQALQGDHRAFAEIVREHQGMVFSIGWHFFADRALAEDLAQEVFLQLYQRRPAIQSAAHLVHWLRRTAVHRCIDHSRRKNFRRESSLDEIPEIATGTALADSFLHKRLRQTLTQLPEKQRMVVVLRYEEELGPGEIAELLNMRVNTVKSTLHRALEELRGKLTRKLKEARYAIF
jgi:RNA polymerase sigma-70 factor (ECF subfamily)